MITFLASAYGPAVRPVHGPDNKPNAIPAPLSHCQYPQSPTCSLQAEAFPQTFLPPSLALYRKYTTFATHLIIFHFLNKKQGS